jgi:hypothetical protein
MRLRRTRHGTGDNIMTGSYTDVWHIAASDFPTQGSAAEKLGFLVRYAILAPSGHNGQPWRFHLTGDVLQIRADRTRALPTIDPHDRELLIACAGALHHARVALHHFGHKADVRILPDPADADLLATVRIGPPVAPAPGDLFTAVTTRHCNRGPYRPDAPSAAQLDLLHDAAGAEGAWLAVLTDRLTKAAVADLIALGDRIKWRDPVFRHELADRLIPNRGRRRDGMPGNAFGVPGPTARLAPAMVRRLDLGLLRARTDRAAANASPALLVIGTDRDDPPAWMAAGQAMSHILLRATAEGLATAFLSQAIEVPELRSRLAALLDHPGHPQILLRVGHPRRRSQLAPRRPLDDVLTSDAAPPLDEYAATTRRSPS